MLCHAAVGSIGHVWWGRLAWQGQIGVDVFFALSGFLLYRPFLVGRASAGNRIGTWRFWRRRALRILPAYWIALTLLAIWPGLPGVFTGDWWRYYFFLQVYPGAPGNGLGVAWTLCIEVTFYLLLPLYAAVAARVCGPADGRGRPLLRELTLLALLAAASFVLRHGVWYDHVPTWTTVTILFQFDYFAAGMALAAVSVFVAESPGSFRPVQIIERFPGVCFGLAFVAFLVLWRFAGVADPAVPALHLAPGTRTFANEEANHWLIAFIAVLIMLPMVFGDARRGVSRRLLSGWPVVGLGVISYSVYLWHSQLLGSIIVPHVLGHRWTWIGGTPTPALLAGTLAITLPVALLSYRFIELPFLRRRYRIRFAAPRERTRPPANPAPGQALRGRAMVGSAVGEESNTV